MPRQNTLVTVAAGTPVQLATTRILAREIFIQMAIGGSGVGYVMIGQFGINTPSHSTTGDLTAQLGSATTANPGGNYADLNSLGIDLSTVWIDGSHTGDTVIVSWDQLSQP